MRFRCTSCLLRMTSIHFQQDKFILTSICDVCRQAGRQTSNYSNDPIQVFAEKLEVKFAGRLWETDKLKSDIKDGKLIDAREGKLHKNLENLLTNYDTNELIQSQVTRSQLNETIWGILTGVINPILTGDYKVDFKTVGLVVKYDLNKLDFISREIIRHQYHNRCQYCGRFGASVDHKNPVSLSDDNSPANLTLACQECNGIKGNMPYQFFVDLNNQLLKVNQQLVDYENLINKLQEEFSSRHNKLVALTHLKEVVDDPELRVLRKQNKELQSAIDSVNSDYLELRNSRKKYFYSQWKLYLAVTKQALI